MRGNLREKCAVAAVIEKDAPQSASAQVADLLFALQHRGDEATGIASQPSNGKIAFYHGEGLVRDVFKEDILTDLTGSMAIGHNRYSTNGRKDCHMQPFVDDGIGFAFAHNGNLPVTDYLEKFLSTSNIPPEYRNDSEMMGLAIAQHIRQGQSLADAVQLCYPYFKGSFSCVAMHNGVIVAFRDRKGIRPLAFGKTDHGYAVSSETCGLDYLGAEYIRDVAPGEMIVIKQDGYQAIQVVGGEEKLDIFEFVYFARHDSYLYGKNVNEFRRRSGEILAKEHRLNLSKKNTTLVIPVPDTSVPASEGYADTLSLKHRQAIIKNRFIPGRSFMQPTQENRMQLLRRKHNIIPEAVEGKNLILIDDSIVRLNTLPRLVELAYSCGAKTVSVLIASPPVRFPDFYGIDTPSQSELAASYMTVEQMKEKIGCEYLGFLSLPGLIAATGIDEGRFNLSCFNGQYPIGIGQKWEATIKPPISMEYVDY